jgi:hypothetical protein
MAERRRRRVSVRALLRAVHRDVGYLAVGLTFVYALSGLAVNHIADWDPNFTQIERTHPLPENLPKDDQEASKRLLDSLNITEAPTEVYRADAARLDIVFDNRTLHVDFEKRLIVEEGQDPRFFLRLANWLHLNRGKKAWTYVADGYAGFLLFLATSGMFMLAGRKGLLGRGAVLVTLGAAVPILYVTLSGGP